MQIFDHKISMSFRMKENFYLLHNFCYVSTDLHINVYQRILQQARIVLNVPYPKQKKFEIFSIVKCNSCPKMAYLGLGRGCWRTYWTLLFLNGPPRPLFVYFRCFQTILFLKKRFIGIQTRIVGTEWKNAVTAQSSSFVSLKP